MTNEYCAPEVHHILEGIPLYHCLRSFVNLIVKTSEWEQLQIRGEGDTVRGKCLLETYADRRSESEISLCRIVRNFTFTRNDWVRKGLRAKRPIVWVFPHVTITGDTARDE